MLSKTCAHTPSPVRAASPITCHAATMSRLNSSHLVAAVVTINVSPRIRPVMVVNRMLMPLTTSFGDSAEKNRENATPTFHNPCAIAGMASLM